MFIFSDKTVYANEILKDDPAYLEEEYLVSNTSSTIQLKELESQIDKLEKRIKN